MDKIKSKNATNTDAADEDFIGVAPSLAAAGESAAMKVSRDRWARAMVLSLILVQLFVVHDTAGPTAP